MEVFMMMMKGGQKPLLSEGVGGGKKNMGRAMKRSAGLEELKENGMLKARKRVFAVEG